MPDQYAAAIREMIGPRLKAVLPRWCVATEGKPETAVFDGYGCVEEEHGSQGTNQGA